MKTKSDTQEIYIGTYPLACINVDLFVSYEDAGGSLRFRPDKKSLPKMTVGFGQKNCWEEIVCILLHESFEFCASLQDHTYKAAGRYDTKDSGDYLFTFDHNEFSRLCEYQAVFISEAIPALKAAHQKFKKRKCNA